MYVPGINICCRSRPLGPSKSEHVRPTYAAVHLSMNNSSISVKEDFSGGEDEWTNTLMSIGTSIL